MGYITRIIHDLGLAAWWGGSLMGTMAMNPAVEVLDDPEERGKMMDEGWALFQPWAAAGLTAAIISHIIMRRNPPKAPTQRFKTIARIKDVLYGAAVASSAASMALGEYVVNEELELAQDDLDEDEPFFDHNTPAQNGLTTATLAQLITGACIFAAGALLVYERDK